MSSAVVLMPSIFPVVFPSAATSAGAAATGFSHFGASSGASAALGGATFGAGTVVVGFAATALLVPIAASFLLTSMAETIVMEGRCEKTCPDHLQAAAKHIEQQMNIGLEGMKESLKKAILPLPRRASLELEIAGLEKAVRAFTAKIGKGAFSRGDIAQFKELLERFSESLAREESRSGEIRRLYDYYADRLKKALAAQNFPKEKKTDIGKRFEEIDQMSVVEMEARLDRLVHLFDELDFSAKKAGDPEADRLRKLRFEARFYFDRITRENTGDQTTNFQTLMENLDQTVFPDKVEGIRDELKLSWQKIDEKRALSEFFRERLQELQPMVASDKPLTERIERTLQAKDISRNTYQEMKQAIEEFLVAEVEKQRRVLVEEKVRKGLAELDYVVLKPEQEESLAERLARGEIALIDTRYDEYKLLVRIGKDDSLAIRFVRLVADDSEKHDVSDFQKQKDLEVMKTWCTNMDLLAENLRKGGLRVTETLRVEDKVDYVTIEQLDQQNIDTQGLKKNVATKKAVLKSETKK